MIKIVCLFLKSDITNSDSDIANSRPLEPICLDFLHRHTIYVHLSMPVLSRAGTFYVHSTGSLCGDVRPRGQISRNGGVYFCVICNTNVDWLTCGYLLMHSNNTCICPILSISHSSELNLAFFFAISFS